MQKMQRCAATPLKALLFRQFRQLHVVPLHPGRVRRAFCRR